jgi:hypothetical protein
VALELWEGPRGLEEYAREVFPLEEQANGLTWMLDEGDGGGGGGNYNHHHHHHHHYNHHQYHYQHPHRNGNGNANGNGNGNSNGNGVDHAAHPPHHHINGYITALEQVSLESDGEDDDDGLHMRGLKRDDEEWLA